MSEEEKSVRDFGLFYTVEGVKCVDSACELDILKMLLERSASLSEIAENLDMAPSTLSFTLNKMVKRSLLETARDDIDRRKVNYSISSYMILRSIGTRGNLSEICAEFIRLTNHDPEFLYRGMVGFTASTFMNMGVDLSSTIDYYNRSLVNCLAPKIKGKDRRGILEYVIEYAHSAKTPKITIKSLDPIRVCFNQTPKLSLMPS